MLKDIFTIIKFILQERDNKIHERKLMQILKSKFEHYTIEQLNYAINQMQKSDFIKIKNEVVINNQLWYSYFKVKLYNINNQKEKLKWLIFNLQSTT